MHFTVGFVDDFQIVPEEEVRAPKEEIKPVYEIARMDAALDSELVAIPSGLTRQERRQFIRDIAAGRR